MNPPIPFGDLCIKHGGYLPSVRANAEREFLATMRGDRGFISVWQRRELMRGWERSQIRYARRLARKYGTPIDGAPPAKPSPARPQKPQQPPGAAASDLFKYEGWN